MYTIKIPNVDPKWIVLGGAVAGSLLLGGGGGYFIAVKKLNKEYDEKLIKELQETKEFLQFTMDEEKATPENIDFNEYAVEVEVVEDAHGVSVKDAAKVMVNYAGVEKVDDEVLKAYDVLNRIPKESTDEVVEETVNVFDTADGVVVWDQASEEAQRDPLIPYVISEDEFMQNDPNHDQTQLTYFQGDDILADVKDEVISDVNGTVGEDNLTKFGHGTESPNTVFIRNEKLDLDFEVERSFSSYAEEVQGFIKHSHESRKARRFRGDDE
jgi:hypothetical protein